MALSKKGTRKISVDGVEYRWAIRKRATYCQAAFAWPMTFAVECIQAPQSVLVVTTTIPRPDNWLQKPSVAISPAQVAKAIRQAHQAGWQPEVRGSAFMLSVDIPVCQQDAAPNSRTPSRLSSSLEIHLSDSQRTPSHGGCG